MTLDRKRANLKPNPRTNPPDISALIPVLPGDGPKDRELYGALRGLIEAGTVAPGAKLPTTRDLARRFSISRGAAVAAFEMLISEGYAVARTGAGTFVAREVPHVPVAAGSAPVAERRFPPPLPCAVGISAADPRTQRVLRRLVSHHLARPGPEHFSYGDPRGGLVLREAIAAHLRAARGVRCDPGQIVVTSGAQHGLDLLARAAIRPGDAVWMEDPCYPKARATLAKAGARIVGVPVDGEGLDPAQGERLHPRARAVYVTPSHQFPLGVMMTMRRRISLIEWARRNDAWIIEDDYDSEFRYAGPPLTALQGIDGTGRVIYLGTFSKVLFPGLRVGYAVLPEPLLDAVLDVRAHSDGHPPSLVERALAALLNEGHFAAHIRRTRRRVQEARDRLVEGLRDHAPAGWEVSVPQQGLHLVARFTSPMSDVDIVAAAAQAGVGARALSAMYIDDTPRQGLVLGFSGFPPDELRSAAKRLCGVVRAGA